MRHRLLRTLCIRARHSALACLLLILGDSLLAQDGNYVPGFAGGGRRLVQAEGNALANGVHLMAGQEILLTGLVVLPNNRRTVQLARLLPDGSSRTPWGSRGNGVTVLTDLVPQPNYDFEAGLSAVDGERILLPLSFRQGLSSRAVLLAVQGDGVGIDRLQFLPEPPSPLTETQAVAVALDPQGRYLILLSDANFSGRQGIRVVRVTPDLQVDPGYQAEFAPATLVLYPTDFTVDSQGRVYLLAEYGEPGPNFDGTMVIRLLANGFTDVSFGINGVVRIPSEFMAFPRAIRLDSTGRVVVAGSRIDPLEADRDVSVVRLLANGNYDNSFFSVAGIGGVRVLEMEDILGFGSIDFASSLSILPDQSLVVAGYTRRANNVSNYFMVARLRANGQLDSSFGIGGVNYGTFEQAPGLGDDDGASALALSPDGAVLLAGEGRGAGAVPKQFGVAKLGLAAARVDLMWRHGFESP